MERIYENTVREHLSTLRQMAFIAGPRQAGKTTCAKAVSPGAVYLNWDRRSDRALIIRGPDAVAGHAGLDILGANAPTVIFDELHKYGRWKSFLKGFFDTYADDCRTVVTGSARLDVYRRGGDSLMGRYFLYRLHPLSLGELTGRRSWDAEAGLPSRPPADALDQLLACGGFPEPFLNGTASFGNRWRRLRQEQLFQEDMRDLTRIHELAQMELVGQLLIARTGGLLTYSSLAAEANVAVDTIRRWLAALERLYYCFVVTPWFRNVPKSLRRQPKVYLWDWSLVAEPGARRENMVASHLLKAVHWWTDIGLGAYKLHFLRDKGKREVDFLVTKDQSPWLLVEVKSSAGRELSPSLAYFQELLNVPHAVQVAFDLPYVERDCFAVGTRPRIVPASTFLSQLA